MFTTKSKTTRVSELHKAIKACEDGGVYNNHQLTLVGTAYTSDMLSKQIPCKSDFDLLGVSSKGLNSIITFTPQTKDLDVLDTFRQLAEEFDVGEFQGDKQILKAPITTPLEVDVLLGTTVMSNIQNYDFELVMKDISITKTTAKINKVPYYQFCISETIETTKGKVNHMLTLVFKPKFYDQERFLDAIVSQDDESVLLNKSDTAHIINSLMEPNITGLNIIGISFTTRYNSISTAMFPLSTDIEIATATGEEKGFWFISSSGNITLSLDKVKKSWISKVSTYAYNIHIITSDGEFKIALSL